MKLGRPALDRGRWHGRRGNGQGGQRLFPVPALDLVVVATAGYDADAIQSWPPLAIPNRFVLAGARPPGAA